MGGELGELAVALGAPHGSVMSAITASQPRPTYQRQTPSVWQALGRAVWDALEAHGRRRAERELRGLAQRWAQIDPAVAAQLRAATAQPSNDNSKDTA
jgi:hypothetical protein